MTPRPRVITCRGGSTRARLAAEVARELEATRAAGPVVDLASENAASVGQSGAIAIDGCSSRCGYRLASARGIRLVAALDLAGLGVREEDAELADRHTLAAQVAARLASEVAPPPPARPHRHSPARPAAEGRAHSVDDYLLAIDALTSPIVECGAVVTDAPTLASHVSDVLGVSRASAGEMLRKLESEGLVRRGSRKELLLSPEGRAQADVSVRRQRLLEVFVTRFLGYEPAESHGRARLLSSSFDDDALSRLNRQLGRPERCPHGCPIDAVRAREEARLLRTLPSLAVGDRARIAWLPERDGTALRMLLEDGIHPNVELVVTGVTAAGELGLDVDGRAVLLDGSVAGEVLVLVGVLPHSA